MSEDRNDYRLWSLFCDAVQSCKWLPTFRSNVPPPSLTMVTTYKTTRRHNPEDHNRYLHGRENLKSEIRSPGSTTAVFSDTVQNIQNRKW
jgi:hypothetical protein